MDYVIRIGTPADFDAWFAEMDGEQWENGEGGVYFSPYSAHAPGMPRGAIQAGAYAERLALPPGETRWLRLWLVIETASGEAVGHATLSGGAIESELHRCTLGMGVRRAHHRRGLGRGLLGAVLAWAREEPSIAWVDLGVFAGNAPARALYARHAFTEVGSTPDRFRVDGVSIEDVQMVLRVG